MAERKFASGHKLVPFDRNDFEKFSKRFPNFQITEGEYGRFMPGGYISWTELSNHMDEYYNFQTNEDDVMIMSFPKCGTMWISEVVWSMRNFEKINTDLAKKTLMTKVTPYFMDCLWEQQDMQAISGLMTQTYPTIDPNGLVLLQAANLAPKPRTLRTHLPLSLCPPKMVDQHKVVFITRNPKDVCISYFHFLHLIKSFQFDGDFDDFIDAFLKDSLPFCPFWEFTKEGWAKRNHPNFHLIHFEDLKKDTRHEIERLNIFLGTNLKPDQLDEVFEFTSFSKMKARDPVFGAFNSQDGSGNSLTRTNSDNFFRKGLSGGWKTVLTEAQNKKIDIWTNENLKGSDLVIKYD